MNAQAKKEVEWTKQPQNEPLVAQSDIVQSEVLKNLKELAKQGWNLVEEILHYILVAKVVKKYGPNHGEWEEVGPNHKINGGF